MKLEEKNNNMHKCLQNYIRRFDEYYTRYEHVKNIFERYIPVDKLKDKIIYCPCDSEESNFVIYLKEHKDDLGYKELIYTWDDYNTHMDLFNKADIIITNPPFSKLIKEFIPILNECDKDFFILGSQTTLCSYFFKFNKDNIKFIWPDKHFDFILPEGCELKNNPIFIYISNMDIPNYIGKTNYRNGGYKATTIDDDKTYKIYDRMDNIPPDEYDEIYVPVTVLLEQYRQFFDIKRKVYRGRCSDGKSRYLRLLVKRKKYT